MAYSLLAIAGIAGTSFSLALSGALMPGPLLTITIAEAARRGAWAGPLLMTGHACLELLLVAGIMVGLGPYLKSPAIIGTISLAGGMILVGMGGDMVRRASSLSLDQAAASVRPGRFDHPVLLGIIGSLVNPFWILWWVTIGFGYLATASRFGLPGLAAFFLGHIAADYGWYILIALGISRGKTLISDTGYQIMIRCCGVFLCGFGIWFLKAAFYSLSAAMNG